MKFGSNQIYTIQVLQIVHKWTTHGEFYSTDQFEYKYPQGNSF